MQIRNWHAFASVNGMGGGREEEEGGDGGEEGGEVGRKEG